MDAVSELADRCTTGTTLAAAGLLLERARSKPPAGVEAARVTTAVTVPAPVTLLGLSVSEKPGMAGTAA